MSFFSVRRCVLVAAAHAGRSNEDNKVTDAACSNNITNVARSNRGELLDVVVIVVFLSASYDSFLQQQFQLFM